MARASGGESATSTVSKSVGIFHTEAADSATTLVLVTNSPGRYASMIGTPAGAK